MGEVKNFSHYSGSGVLYLTAICFFVGGICGSLFSILAQGESAVQLHTYLHDYIELIQTEIPVWSMCSVLWCHGRWILLCLLFSLTLWGMAVIPFVFAARGFLLAFSIGCFVRFLGQVGVFTSIFVFGIPAMLWVPTLFLCGTISFSRCLWLTKCKRSDTSTIPISARIVRRSIIAATISLALCTTFECVFLPGLLSLIAGIFG